MRTDPLGSPSKAHFKIGSDPHSDSLYYQFHKYSADFQKDPSRENAHNLYQLMYGNAALSVKTPFDAIALYIHPAARQEAFELFQKALWALHSYVHTPDSHHGMASMWLSHLWGKLF